MQQVDIVQAHPHLTVPHEPLAHLIRGVVASEEGAVESLTVVLTDHETVLEMNRSFLDHDYHTDVLAFDLSEDEGVDGEIYVDLDTAAERCEEFGATFDHEAARYVLHGLLHLLGYRDKQEEDQVLMKQREDEYLRRFINAK